MTVARVLPIALNPDDEVAVLDRGGISRRIRHFRHARGWAQADLAAACDVDRVTIARWETARTVPGVVGFCRLADAFEMTTDYLIRGQP